MGQGASGGLGKQGGLPGDRKPGDGAPGDKKE
jgi:26S proteasome regulatory subunit T2